MAAFIIDETSQWREVQKKTNKRLLERYVSLRKRLLYYEKLDTMLLGHQIPPILIQEVQKFRSEKKSRSILSCPWSVGYVLSKPSSHCAIVFVGSRSTLHLRSGRWVCWGGPTVLVRTVLM
jgi:hypothetical protein